MNSTITNEIDIPAFSEKETGYKIKSGENLKINIHENFSAFAGLEEEWNRLAEKSNQTIFMSFDWVNYWWKHFGRHKKRSFYIITVHFNQELIAIFPFYKGVTTLGSYVIEQRLQLIGSGGSPNEQLGSLDDYGISDFLDFIVHPEYNQPIADLFVSMLSEPILSGYRITLHQIRDDSYIKQYIYPQLKDISDKITIEHTDTCPYIKMEGVDSLKSFIKQKKSNARRRFRQTLRAINEDQEYVIEEAEAYEKIEPMKKTLIKLHQERWNQIGFPGVFHDERFRSFFNDILYSAYQKNRLWFKQARDSGGICASRMLMVYNGRYYDYMSGFDYDCPSAKYRPGIGLLLNLIEDSLDQPVQSIELLRGEESYKYDFTRYNFKNWKITIPVSIHDNRGVKIPDSIIHFIFFIYKYYRRETTLLKVQYEKAGLLKMVFEYMKFRTSTLIDKIKNR